MQFTNDIRTAIRNNKNAMHDPDFVPNPHRLMASVGGTSIRPGYYGHNAHELVWVAPLDCPDALTLEQRKRDAGVMTVRAYLPS